MTIHNLRTTTCPFDEYLELPGWSYSGIKNDGKAWEKPTQKMQLGTHVHNYLLTPEEYKHDDLRLVKPIALALKARIGPLLAYLQPELAVLCDFVHEGITMPYKGRLDLAILNKIVIDIKVSEMPLHKAVDYFGYDKQLSGYAMSIAARVALIIGINPKNLLTTVYNVPIHSFWWEQQIKSKGEVII